MTSLELWGGVECTYNRLGVVYFDQLELNGHNRRPADLDQIATLGVRTLRYPVLWERMAGRREGEFDWSWSDERLGRLHQLGIGPIAGLLHHGGGPKYTSLLDPHFPKLLALYAAAVAARYPWVQAYTPVNEPLTTARFSTLYGHWHPHLREDRAFATAMLNQCRGVVLAMREIRRVRSDAQLVQTEDLARTHGTAALRYQVDFENERRWLTYDLLTGRVDRHHPIGAFFLYLGVSEADLLWFQENPCPPDVLGVNYYLTSERYLDERLERFPGFAHGGNGRDRYADVEAVRVGLLAGPRPLLREVWQRYQSAFAVTEAHLECSREEQMRWLLEVWRAAQAVREEGAEIRAVTAWALLGSHDWDSLVTKPRGHYQPGAFDIRSPQPRPTALAGLIRDLATGRPPSHPLVETPGWWERPDCAHYLLEEVRPSGERDETAAGPILVAGGEGCLGKAFGPICAARGIEVVLLGKQQMDVCKTMSVESALDRYRPWAVINASGYCDPDTAESEYACCRAVNVLGATILAAACACRGIPLLSFSCHYVFDGRRREPYRESDPVNPLGVLGLSKAEAEREIAHRYSDALILRTGPLFGFQGGTDFVYSVLHALARGQSIGTAEDETVSPTYIPDLVPVALDLLIDGERGVWHLANRGATTWTQLGRAAARQMKLQEGLVKGCSGKLLGRIAPRPAYTALRSERGQFLPTLDSALERHVMHWQISEAAFAERAAAEVAMS